MAIKEKITQLLGRSLPFDLQWLPPETYLVGGAVRDALLSRQREYVDLDFVLVADAVAIARKIANAYSAGFVVLDDQRNIARVVFPDGTADFAQQEGESLQRDLQRRDFTINAIAYNPHTQELIDPLGGLRDLEQKQLRMVSKSNLQDDPLRLLRAYRQASQLHFTIETDTHSTIRHLAPDIKTVAAERVQSELNYLLYSHLGTPWLCLAIEDGLFSPWLAPITSEKLQQVMRVDEVAQGFGKALVAHSPKSASLAKLASLVASQPEEAQLQLVALKYSRAETRAVTTALEYLPVLHHAQATPMSLREQYFFFLNVKDVFPLLALLALAVGVTEETMKPLVQHYLNFKDAVAHGKPIVNGKELMRSLELSPSPLIGELLTEIQIAQIEGKIATPQEAINYAHRFIESH